MGRDWLPRNVDKKLPLRTGRLYPKDTPGAHFCQRLTRRQGHGAARNINSMKNPNDPYWESDPRPSDLWLSPSKIYNSEMKKLGSSETTVVACLSARLRYNHSMTVICHYFPIAN